jgi:hypothetical protein
MDAAGAALQLHRRLTEEPAANVTSTGDANNSTAFLISPTVDANATLPAPAAANATLSSNGAEASTNSSSGTSSSSGGSSGHR